MISGAEDKLIGKFKLIRSGGAVVFEEGVEPLSTQVHDSIFNKLKSKNVKSFIFNDSGEKYLVGFSQIKLTKAEKGYGFGGTFESIDHKKGNKGESWYVICYRQMSVALSPITESIKSFILIGTAIIVILVLVSQLFGRKIAKPLALLDKATEKIGKGDFEYRIDMGQNDEFGNLAHSFNNMASTLQQSTTSIDLLRESEGRYRNIFENIQDVYYEASMDGTILEVSPSIENVSEYKKKEVIGKSLYDFYTDPKEREELLNAILVSEKVANFEITLTDKDGSPHPVELNTTLQRDQKGNPIKLIGSMRDISKRKQLEARLRHSRKMEAIGTLAGGIAHEFNNILTTVIGNTELAIADVPASNPARECLEEIQTASLRAKDVVSQLLGFARKTVFQLMPVRINPIVSETLKLIRASIPTTIEIRQDLSCQSDTVLADTTQIKQVLMNLCANANNAMQEEGGVLDVNLENTTLDETSAAGYEDLGPGNYLKMTVRDTGHGIDPKIIDRIFDPYFTTTSLAEGTGMGLAVVHGIIKHHNGAITVESEPGKGTVFEVLFPLVEAEADQEAGEPEALPAGNEKILFVDDEPSLVKMAKRMLEMQGYRVEAKGNPVEALEMVRSEPDRFDLVITDMTMPKMTGDKLSKEILGIRPDMPILLCSGYSDRIDADRAAALGIRKYIEKPLDMSDFVVTIRKVLDDEAKVKIQQ